jgi:hypothetical protein
MPAPLSEAEKTQWAAAARQHVIEEEERAAIARHKEQDALNRLHATSRSGMRLFLPRTDRLSFLVYFLCNVCTFMDLHI